MAGISREEFLENVRRSLGKTGPVEEPDYLPLKQRRQDQHQRAVTIEARNQARRPELLNQITQTARNQGWIVYRAGSGEEVVGYVVALAKEKKARLVVRSDHPVFSRVLIDGALRREGARITTVAVSRSRGREYLREEMARADLGVTGVDYAIAETGTCVLLPRRGVSRAVSLLPPLHVAIVEAGQVYESLDDLFALRRLAFLMGRADMGSYLSFISGPSRTGDIEQTIVIGVHGPVEVHMVILEEEEK
jgi:L-lactate dehydrogenase complex protein LldG